MLGHKIDLNRLSCRTGGEKLVFVGCQGRKSQRFLDIKIALKDSPIHICVFQAHLCAYYVLGSWDILEKKIQYLPSRTYHLLEESDNQTR